MAKLTVEEETARAVLETLARLTDMSNREVAERAGWRNYQTAHQRRTGEARIGLSDVRRLAEVFEVPVEMFGWELPMVFRWVADNPVWAARWTRRAKGAWLSSTRHAA